MGWREQLRPASFRGAAFSVLSHNFESGRRLSVHEYPQRDNPFVEDLGRKARSFRIEGFILGDEYMAARDKLVKACTTPGISFPFKPGGQLTHPYLGALEVVCQSIRVRETASEGRLCRVSMAFVESGFEPKPSSRRGAPRTADDQAAALDAAAGAELTEALLTDGVPQTVRLATSGPLAALGEIMDDMDLTGLTQDIAAFRDLATSLINDAAVIATAPASVVASVQAAASAIFDAAGNALEGLFAYEAMFGVSNSLGGGSSTFEVQADLNTTAVTNLIYSAALSGAVRSAVRAEFAALPDAEARRDSLLAQLDSLAATAGDGTYQALRDIAATLTEGVPDPAQQLADVEELILPAAVPSLVLAWDLYGDRGREAELVARNNPPRPGFMPGGVPLQVLVDA